MIDPSLYILWDDAKEPEWTPWNKSLEEKVTLHKYINKNFMASFISKRLTSKRDHPEYEKSAWLQRFKKYSSI